MSNKTISLLLLLVCLFGLTGQAFSKDERTALRNLPQARLLSVTVDPTNDDASDETSESSDDGLHIWINDSSDGPSDEQKKAWGVTNSDNEEWASDSSDTIDSDDDAEIIRKDNGDTDWSDTTDSDD